MNVEIFAQILISKDHGQGLTLFFFFLGNRPNLFWLDMDCTFHDILIYGEKSYILSEFNFSTQGKKFC